MVENSNKPETVELEIVTQMVEWTQRGEPGSLLCPCPVPPDGPDDAAEWARWQAGYLRGLPDIRNIKIAPLVRKDDADALAERAIRLALRTAESANAACLVRVEPDHTIALVRAGHDMEALLEFAQSVRGQQEDAKDGERKQENG